MAKKFYIKQDKSFEYNQPVLVDGEEFNHIANVLRKKVHDKICVIDGSGTDYECEIEQINKKDLILKIVNMIDNNSETQCDVTVFQALVKGDKFELIIQKLTELGVKNFVPFESEFCQVKSNTTRLDRLDKISIEALKQCGRSKKVEIGEILSFDKMIEKLKEFEKVVFAFENSTTSLTEKDLEDQDGKKLKKIAIVVGSEGGFSEKENELITKQANVKQISMGNRILRAETAAISLTSVVMFLLGEWERK